MATEEVTVKEFIDTKLIPQMLEMADKGYAYYVFGILGQAIELVGAMFVGEIETTAKEPERFLEGVSKIFAGRNKYTNIKAELYTSLRNAMIHQLRPGSKFLLTRLGETKAEMHLERDGEGRVILVIQEMIGDFKKGMVAIYKSHAIDAKLNQVFYQVFSSDLPQNLSSEFASGSTFPSYASTNDPPQGFVPEGDNGRQMGIGYTCYPPPK